ncbi:MAG: glycosyltransferase family 2 protein [Gemmataceae bacterium]
MGTAEMSDSHIPRVSVVLPVHNGERFLAEALDSVLTQTFDDFELLAIDDGSADRTPEILAGYAAKDRRVRIVANGKQGFAQALNSGIELARGDYIARMDADDICLPQRFARQVQFLDANRNITACGSDVEVFEPRRVGDYRLPRSSDAVRCHLLFYCALSHPTVMMRTKDIRDLDPVYRPEYGGTCDFDLWCRLDRGGLRMANIPEVLVRYRRHAAQITTSDGDRQVTLANQIRKEHLAHYGLMPSEAELRVHWAMGRWDYRFLGENLEHTRGWLDTLFGHLSIGRGFPTAEFRKTLADTWYSACLHHRPRGLRLANTYRTSLFGRQRPLRFLRLATAL